MTRRRRSTSAAWAAAHEASANADAIRTARLFEADKSETKIRDRRARNLAEAAETQQKKLTARAQELRDLARLRTEQN